jgi:hypothetical protein
MFVKFRPSSDTVGIPGLKAAILQAATAPAGTDPANPLPARVAEWEVLDNSVAGGWTINTTVTDWQPGETVDGDAALPTTSQTIFAIEADTPKTSVHPKAEKKVFYMFYSHNTNSVYNNFTFRAGQLSSVGIIESSQLLNLTGNTYADDVGVQYVSLGGNSRAYEYTWYVSVTQEYIWVYKEHAPDQGSSAQRTKSRRGILGVSDLTYATDWEQTAGSPHFPVGGFWQHATNSGSTTYGYQQTYGDSHLIKAYGIGHQDESYSARYGETVDWIVDYSNLSVNSVRQQYTIPLGPAYKSIATASDNPNTDQYYKSGWDEKGFDRTSLTDVTFMSPLTGWNARSCKGIKLGGWNRYLNTYEQEGLHRSIVAVDTEKYMLFNVARSIWAVKLN